MKDGSWPTRRGWGQPAHIGEQGTSPPMPMAEFRHEEPESVRRCFEPSPEAIAELTSVSAPDDGHR